MNHQNFTILKQQTKSMVLTENPCHLPLDGAVSDEMNEIGRESSLGSDLMMLTRRLRCFKP